MMLPNITFNRLNGTLDNLQNYSNQVLLVVNVASQCGFTSQYRELESIYQSLHSEGLEILAFPCNQFGGQEPGSPEEIQSFCERNYSVTFPIFEKIEVNGSNTHPFFDFLKSAAPGLLGTTAIKWNFTKFLINRDGTQVKRYASATSPKEIIEDIKKFLIVCAD
jgi:glutathione peroxidase